MKTLMGKFTRHIIIFTVILMLISLILYFLLPPLWFSVSLPFLFFFFLSSTILSYYVLLKSLTKRFSRFVNIFLLTTVAKLMLYVTVIIVYVILYRQDAFPFLAGFFILYICYTIFEVVKLVSVTRKPESPDNQG